MNDRRRWWLILGGILLVAAVLRFHDLATRGTWDADQGHDMLMLTAFVRDGTFPLLGPPTSIGDFHHGALYYYLLAPAAWLGGGDPAVVVGEIALLGVLAVGLVASLARTVGGTTAGVIAGSIMALSATAIDESTFLWNPNLVAFTSALAVTAAWRAWTTQRARWWLLVAAAQAATMQCHVLGFVLLPPLVVWLIADARRRPAPERRTLLVAALGAAAVVALSYLPLLASELQTDFHETRAALAFLAGGGQAVAAGPLVRLVFVSLRILAWPLTGLLTAALAVGVAAAVGVGAVAAWRARVAPGAERDLARWLAATMVWSCLVLGIAISGLASVTPLPVDHYHAFLDPLIYVVVGLGLAALARLGAPAVNPAAVAALTRLPGLTVGGVAAVGLVVVLGGWNVVHWPPSVAADGGYPAAEVAAQRIVTDVGGRIGLLASLPDFKTAEAYVYPVQRLGGQLHSTLVDAMGLEAYVVVCDALFVDDCGGPAEDRSVAALGQPLRLVDRFVAAPGRTISVYIGSAPVATLDRGARLVVDFSGRIGCGTFPYGCAATLSVLPPDAAVTDDWRPPASDPRWGPDYSKGLSANHIDPTPQTSPPVIPPGRHEIVLSLLGSYDTPSYNPDGSVATDLLSRCLGTVEIGPATGVVHVRVTFTPDPESFRATCTMALEPGPA